MTSVLPSFFDALQVLDLRQIDQLLRLHEALLHGRQHGLSAGQGLRPIGHLLARFLDGGWAFVGKCVHVDSFDL